MHRQTLLEFMLMLLVRCRTEQLMTQFCDNFCFCNFSAVRGWIDSTTGSSECPRARVGLKQEQEKAKEEEEKERNKRREEKDKRKMENEEKEEGKGKEY